MKNIVTTTQVSDHLDRLQNLDLIENVYNHDRIFPGDPIYTFNFDHENYDIDGIFGGDLSCTPVKFNGNCTKHNTETMNDCAQEIRDELEELIFNNMDTTDVKLQYHKNLLKLHIKDFSLYV